MLLRKHIVMKLKYNMILFYYMSVSLHIWSIGWSFLPPVSLCRDAPNSYPPYSPYVWRSIYQYLAYLSSSVILIISVCVLLSERSLILNHSASSGLWVRLRLERLRAKSVVSQYVQSATRSQAQMTHLFSSPVTLTISTVPFTHLLWFIEMSFSLSLFSPYCW